MCRINPRVDFAFKKLFGSEENKDLLISLINAIVSKQDQVVDIILKNPYNLADYREGKMSILDIKAVDHVGRWYNIEMQIGQDIYFDKRAIYYWAKLLNEQLSTGLQYNELKKTVSITILGFNLVPGDKTFHNTYKIINTTTGEEDNLHDIFELHYVELKKFHKKFPDIATPLDRWVTFLTKAHELDKGKIPDVLAADSSIVKAIEAVDRMFSEEERDMYDIRKKNLMDIESRIDSALEVGLKQGREQSTMNMAIKMFKSGKYSYEEIAELTGLSIEQIKTFV